MKHIGIINNIYIKFLRLSILINKIKISMTRDVLFELNITVRIDNILNIKSLFLSSLKKYVKLTNTNKANGPNWAESLKKPPIVAEGIALTSKNKWKTWKILKIKFKNITEKKTINNEVSLI